jgi:hypothetical protein
MTFLICQRARRRACSAKRAVTFATEDLLDPGTRGTLFVANATRGSPPRSGCRVGREHPSLSRRGAIVHGIADD